MEVVKPELYWVQDRCYRRNPKRNDYRVLGASGKPELENTETQDRQGPYEEYEEFSCDPDAPDEDEDNMKYKLEKIESGFKSQAETIPSAFFPFIIGAKGATKKRIESETNTKIIVPRINERGNIVVRGSKRKDVLNALRRLDLMCNQARAKRDVTHFACFPMNDPLVVSKFNEFKEKVLAEFSGVPGSGLEERIFQEVEKLHLTISVMTLLDARERDNAARLLQSLETEVKNICGNKPLKVTLRGLEIMNDDPSEVHVLYAKCMLEDSGLQDVADMVAKHFGDSGYARNTKGERVKLHATLVNTRFRSESSEEAPPAFGGRTRDSFDARKILEKYGDFEFGVVEVNEVLIVTRHTKDKSGFYNTMAKVKLS